jgi:hypothetical protein
MGCFSSRRFLNRKTGKHEDMKGMGGGNKKRVEKGEKGTGIFDQTEKMPDLSALFVGAIGGRWPSYH